MSDAGNGSKTPMQERMHQAKEKVQHAAAQGKAIAGGATEAVLEHAREKPWVSLAAAFGVGYALGGGLFSPTTGRILRLGVKLAAVPVVQNVLLDLAEAALDGALEQGRRVAPGPTASAAGPITAPGAPRA